MTNAAPRGVVIGYRCATCGATVPIDTLYPFRCPAAPEGDSHHVLHPVVDTSVAVEEIEDSNPFVRYMRSLAWYAFATAKGMSEAECVALTKEVADGFLITPFERSASLSGELGVNLWVKNETGQLGGSHKARHLVTILLHLRAAEELGLASREKRAPLAIASCGNAAIAAATLAHTAGWPIKVFIPDWAGGVVVDRLTSLGAEINRCPRVEGEAGDPAVLRFRETVAGGSVPFSVQGPENGLCLDGGRTIGWEMADASAAACVKLDRVLIQVGGGAFAAGAGWGLGPGVRLDTVQTEGGAPLSRAWERVASSGASDSELGVRWDEFMTPWDSPSSAADGILDDETYDWQADFDVMRRSGGRPWVVSEENVLRANKLGLATGVRVTPTGSAGLAGLLADHDGPRVMRGETVGIVFSGVIRD